MIRGLDLAKRDGQKSYSDWIIMLCQRMGSQLDTPYTRNINIGKSVLARVDFGRWLADCPICNGAEIVDPDEPLFYCFSCGNRDLNGDARLVIFPKNMSEIEGILMDREVDDRKGRNKIEQAFMAKSVKPGLSRSWNPTETAEDLKRQNHGL